MIERHVGSVLVLVALAHAGATTQSTSPPHEDSVVTIDGATNPELIPNWAAWLEAFRFMAAPATPVEPIPATLFPVTTEAQRALIRHEALAVVDAEIKLAVRAAKLREKRTRTDPAGMIEQVEALEMKRRRAA